MFILERKVSDDTHNRVKDGDVEVWYKLDDKVVGYINYRPHNGQIGIIDLLPSYRYQGLGKQMLLETVQEAKQHGVDELWGVASKDHSVWKNIFGGKMKWRTPAHSSVGGDGYYIKIDDIPSLY